MNSPSGLLSAVPAVLAAPLAAPLRTRLRRAGLAVWRALELHGHMRARRELHNLAERYEGSDPELAQRLRAACRFIDGNTA